MLKRKSFLIKWLLCFRLVEVGRIVTPKLHGKYDTGQLFLHRIFGYRGVVLFPWVARVFDRDVLKTKKGDNEVSDRPDKDDKESVEKFSTTNTFYQVLIDSRDCPYIVRTIARINKSHCMTIIMNRNLHKCVYKRIVYKHWRTPSLIRDWQHSISSIMYQKLIYLKLIN